MRSACGIDERSRSNSDGQKLRQQQMILSTIPSTRSPFIFRCFIHDERTNQQRGRKQRNGKRNKRLQKQHRDKTQLRKILFSLRALCCGANKIFESELWPFLLNAFDSRNILRQYAHIASSCPSLGAPDSIIISSF